MTDSPVIESRAPVGSSARTIAAPAHERSGDRDPLLLAAREVVGVAVGEVPEADAFERLGCLGLRGRDRRAVKLERQRDVLASGEPGEEVQVLEDVADRSPTEDRQLRRIHPADVLPLDEDAAARRPVEPADEREERRLARAARAHDREELATLDAERGRVESDHFGVPGAEAALGRLELDRSRHEIASPARADRLRMRASDASSQRISASVRKMSASRRMRNATSRSGSACALRRV